MCDSVHERVSISHELGYRYPWEMSEGERKAYFESVLNNSQLFVAGEPLTVTFTYPVLDNFEVHGDALPGVLTLFCLRCEWYALVKGHCKATLSELADLAKSHTKECKGG